MKNTVYTSECESCGKETTIKEIRKHFTRALHVFKGQDNLYEKSIRHFLYCIEDIPDDFVMHWSEAIVVHTIDLNERFSRSNLKKAIEKEKK